MWNGSRLNLSEIVLNFSKLLSTCLNLSKLVQTCLTWSQFSKLCSNLFKKFFFVKF